MLEAAASALPAEGTQLLGVTVLTSHTDETFKETGARGTIAEAVGRLVVLARESGIDGVVCSPHEVKLIRETAGDDLQIVTPGIRPKGSARGDQARVTTPLEARRLGCDYIVVGRPITGASSPKDAARAIVDEISRG